MSDSKIFCFTLARGDVINKVKGKDPKEALSALIKLLRFPTLPDKESLVEAIVERESLASTAIGYGYAIPHPRKRIFADETMSILYAVYLDQPIDWHASDGKPVSTLFLVLSGGEWQHLTLLAEIASLVEDPNFRKFMARNPQKNELLDYLSCHQNVKA
jgi:PTS system nitrogen regulatory IIA component